MFLRLSSSPTARFCRSACAALALASTLGAGAASAGTGASLETRSFDLAQAMPFTGTQSGPGLPPVTGFSPSTILNPNGLPPGPTNERDPHTVLPQPPAGKAAIGVSARFGEKDGLIPRGLVWRVFADKAEASGAYPLVAEAVEPAPVFFLSPGGYVLHVSYGLASAARKILVGANSRREQMEIPAGAVKLQSDVNDKLIPAQKVSFDIFEGSFLQGKTSTRPFFRGANSGQILVLPAGSYHVVSTYGEGNAVIQADLTIQPGKVTDAVIHHRAAQITLKLVREAGGKALPDTQWSVLTPGGDTIKESFGAFPAFVLAEGEYAVIARNDGKTYTKEFVVESGKDTDVEVLMKAQAPSANEPPPEANADTE